MCRHFRRFRLHLGDNFRLACLYIGRFRLHSCRFSTWYRAISAHWVITFGVAGACITLTTDTVLCISFSCTVTVSSVTNRTLNFPMIFGKSIVKGVFFMRADLATDAVMTVSAL